MSVDEIKRRFIRQSGSLNDGASDGGPPKPDEPKINEGAARIFDPLRAFQAQLSRILESAKVIEQTLSDAARTVAELRDYHAEMTRLLEAYRTMLPFEAWLNPDSEELRQHFDAIARIFHGNIAAIASLLDPVPEVHLRISRLERILNNLEPMQEQLRTLAHNFEPRIAGDLAPPDQPPTPSAAVSILRKQ
jgi:hypothetical protein